MARVLQLDSLGNIVEIVNPQTASDTAFDPSKLGKLSSFTVQDAVDELVSKHYTLAADVSGLHTQVDSLTHNGFSDIALAASGVTYGHISDAAQAIYGDKYFQSAMALGPLSSTFSLAGYGILNVARPTASDVIGIANWVRPTANTSLIRGISSDITLDAGLTCGTLFHMQFADSRNSGTVDICRYMSFTPPTKNYNAFAAMRSAVNTYAGCPDTRFIYHSGNAPSTHVGAFIAGADVAWDTVSALQVEGRARFTGYCGIGSTTNAQTALRIDLSLSGDSQSGIRNYVRFTGNGPSQYHGYTSDPNVAVDVTLPIMYHASYGDSFNLGTVQTGGYLRMAAPTNNKYTSFYGIISAIPQTNSNFYFLRHLGNAKSIHTGPMILGSDTAWDAASALQVQGASAFMSGVGIGGIATNNAALRIYNDLGLTNIGQVGIKNYFQPSLSSTSFVQGYESNPTIPAGLTTGTLFHFACDDSRNSGNVGQLYYLWFTDVAKTYSTGAVGIRSSLNTKAFPVYFIAHSGSAPSHHLGSFILGSTDAADSWSTLQLTGNIKYTGFETYAKSQVVTASIVLPASSVTRCHDSCEIAAGVSVEIPAGSILYIE